VIISGTIILTTNILALTLEVINLFILANLIIGDFPHVYKKIAYVSKTNWIQTLFIKNIYIHFGPTDINQYNEKYTLPSPREVFLFDVLTFNI
jgi:hypothetical protein